MADKWLPEDTSKIDMGSVTVELCGVAEIADRYGVARQTVSTWAARRATTGFPEPFVLLSMGPVYDMGAVQRWWDLHRATVAS